MLCKFDRAEVAADHGNNRNTGVFPLYPEYEWGTIAAWAWTHGVVADALNQLELIDMKKIVATGHSRGGKIALCAGIYDERIAITAPNSSGTGGTGSLRYFEKGQREQRLTHHIKFPHWWVPRFFEFGGKEDLLPFDAHTAKALIAPRALINAHARQDYWANPYGTELTYRAADKVFNWLGAENQQERLDVNWIVGFVDGEGCFHVALNKQVKMTQGYQVLPEFRVVQHEKDIQLLHKIQEFFCSVLFFLPRFPNPRGHHDVFKGSKFGE